MFAFRLQDISKRFGSTIALDRVDLEVRVGEVHALVGENGAGKSTLLNILSGAFGPDAGRMELMGEPFAPGSAAESRRRGIAMVHQELALFPHLSVAENIFVGIEPSRNGLFDRDSANRRATELLASFGHARVDPEAKIANLSIAERQVVEICRAMAFGAKLILLDEPTSSLERGDIEKLFALIRKLRSDGVTFIYVSHFLEEIREIADSFTVLRDGASVGCGTISGTTDEKLVEMMVGRKVSELFPPIADVPSTAPAAIEVLQLSSPPQVRNASFTVRRGEIFGIAGLMGSGRTKLVRTLFGLDGSLSGTVKVNGKNGRPITPIDRIRQGVGYLSEDRKNEGLALPLSVADNVTLSAFAKRSAGRVWIDLKAQGGAAEKWVEKLRIRSRSCRQSVGELSGGNQQKVALSRILHQDADVLLLDEPTRGVDIGSKAEIYRAIADGSRAGKAVVLVSSYLPELFGMCHTLAVMNRGVLSAAKPIAEWTAEAVMQTAIGGGRV